MSYQMLFAIHFTIILLSEFYFDVSLWVELLTRYFMATTRQ